MNLLDENIPEDQRQLLRGWRIRIQQIGYEAGRKGMGDEEIVPLLHRLKSMTFFTRDEGFYHRQLCHMSYCLVCLVVGQYESASFIRRVLRHPVFNTQDKRMGRVIRVTHTRIRVWQIHTGTEELCSWPS